MIVVAPWSLWKPPGLFAIADEVIAYVRDSA
jgi:hypothetical protein